MNRIALRVLMAALALLAPLALAAPAHAQFSYGERACLRAHVAGIGWQPWQCAVGGSNSAYPLLLGTVGQGRGIEAVEATAVGFDICLRAHVRNVGWQGQSCTRSRVSTAAAFAGTTGQALPIEALTISFRTNEAVPTGPSRQSMQATGHVQNLGWLWTSQSGSWLRSVTLGTTGQALQLEAIRIAIG
jgi:uncharacterized protein YjdB